MQSWRTLTPFLIGFLLLHLLMTGVFVTLASRTVTEQAVGAVEPTLDSQETAEAQASIDESIGNLQTRLWLISLGFGAVTCVMMIALAARVLQPLNLFSETARRIGAGSLDQSIPMRNSSNQWSVLAEAFGQMQNKLADRESRLRENNQRMGAVLGSMIEGVLSIDADGRVLTANNTACDMLSVSSVELIDRKLLDVIRYPELRRAIEVTQENRDFFESEFETTAQPRRLLKAHVAMLPNDSGELAVVLHDVTDLRALETMRRDFVANVSHELKTPLSSIKAYAETLRLGALHDNEKNVQFVEQIESQAEMLHLQIQDLIELARVETGKASKELVAVPINEVCKKCLEQFDSQVTKLNIDLLFEPDAREPIVVAEPNGIATIVTNLVTNAIHYTPEGSITVRTEKLEGISVIEVIDTGIGIAEDQQSRVFERFYRIDKARSRDMGGTGLGLSIVKHMTQSFGGNVKLKSQIGKGSTFRIELPSESS
ncbi:MAG: ATP-binding protein [Planctomycetota bacterium]